MVAIFHATSSSRQSARDILMEIRRKSRSRTASQNFNKLIGDLGSDDEEEAGFGEYHSDSDLQDTYSLTGMSASGHKLLPLGVVPDKDEKGSKSESKRTKNGISSLSGEKRSSNSASPTPLLDAGEQCPEEVIRFATDDRPLDDDFGAIEVGGPGTRQESARPVREQTSLSSFIHLLKSSTVSNSSSY